MKEFPELKSLIDQEMASVSFVRDYIDLGFDGPVVRLLGQTSICHGEIHTLDGSPGFERAIRNLIGHIVQSIDDIGDSSVSIMFLSKEKIICRSRGSEYMNFVPNRDGRVLVW